MIRGRGSTVPHEVEADLALLVGQPVQRHDLAGVDDRRVQPGLHRLVQEHAVQRMAGRRVEPEADVGHAERRVGAGDLGLDPPDRLDRVDGVPAQVVVAGRQRERQRVEDQVAGRHPVALGGDLVDAMGDLHLPLDVPRWPPLVDQQADDGGAVVTGQRHHAVEPAARQLAVLEVGRVEDGAAADVLEPGLQHRRLGGVEHERDAGLRGEPLGDLVHVDGAVAADVVDADVEHVGALTDLLVGHLRARVPVALEHRVAERLGPVGVRALADDQEREVLLDRDRAVDRRDARLGSGCAAGRPQVAHRVDDVAEVLGRGATAAADDGHAVLADMLGMELGQLLRRQVVVRPPVDDARQAGVRQHADRQRRVLAEVAEVLLHLRRSRGAVDPEDVGAHRRDGHQCGADLAPDEHPPVVSIVTCTCIGTDRPSACVARTAGDHRRLDLQQVHARLDDEEVDAAFQQAAGLLGVGVAQVGEADVPEARQLRARADRTGDVAGPAIGGVAVGDVAAIRAAATFSSWARSAMVLGQHRGEGAEAGRLDGVDADVEERGVHAGDDVGPRRAEHLVAALARARRSRRR